MILRRLVLFLPLVAAAGLAFLSRPRRYVVDGRSMLPAYRPGDRVCVLLLAYRVRSPRAGEAVVVRRLEGRLDLKRLTAGPGDEVDVRGDRVTLGADEWFVTGDNLAESTDSRGLGPVRREDILGPVWFRY